MAESSSASIVIDGVLRIVVRSYGSAGDELLVELERAAPGIVGSRLTLEEGPRIIHAVVKEEREFEGRTTLICKLAVEPANERAEGA